MTNTLRRHKRGWNAVTNTLAVRGTFDRLTGWYWNVTMKYAEARCACCGATHPNTRVPRLSLSEHGKRRLAELRRLRGMS